MVGGACLGGGRRPTARAVTVRDERAVPLSREAVLFFAKMPPWRGNPPSGCRIPAATGLIFDCRHRRTAGLSTASETNASLTLAFGPFRLFPARGVLLEGEKPCRIGSRAMDILLALIERAGETVTKQDLLARVWPDTIIDDANLRVHVAALRKVLGDGHDGARYIVNVMGRGYCFVAPVRQATGPVPQTAPPPHERSLHNLPAPLTHVLGRGDVVESIALQVPMRHCVTITGPGGIGKTTVAIAVAEKLLPVYDDGVWFIDLAMIMDRQLIPFAIASVLGLSVASASPVPSLTAFLQDKRLLLLLDNCEHMVDAVAPLAEAILRCAPNVHILTTSREALRAEGEWVYRLRPIETPPETESLTAAEALQFPAVQLFVERASASLDGFHLTDTDALVVAAICRRLDGLPLAIELAAVRIDMFGLRGLAAVLNEHFLLLSEGHRTAQPRQQSLLGALDWSYRLLSPVEQTILRRLAVFRGDFTLDAAIAVAAGEGISVEQIYTGVLTLSTKSLVTTDVTGDAPQHYHRLLHVTRAFVGHKLRESGESGRVTRRHAEYLCRLLEQAESDWEMMERKRWLEIYGRTIDDVRSALDWAFSPDGDASIGVALSASALPLGFQLSLIDELRTWVERALLHASLLVPSQPLAEMRLNIAMIRLAHNMAAPTPGRTLGFDRAVQLSLQLDSLAHRTEPLIGLAADRMGAADYTIAADLARKAADVAEASGDPKAVLGTNRIAAQTYHFNGDHTAARLLAMRVLDHPIAQIPLAYNSMPVNRHVSMRIILARIAWLQGRAEEAVATAKQATELAVGDSAFSLCQALVLAAIPIALWTGDDAAADAMTTVLAEQAARYSLAFWQSWGTAFGVLLQNRAGISADSPKLAGALQQDTFTTFSVDLLIPATILRADTGEAGWCQPEIHRAQGEWLLTHGAPGAVEAAEALFQRSLDVARRQEAMAWELRTAMSLTRLWQRHGRLQEGRTLLAGVLQRFAEGHATADLKEAAALLASSTQAGGALTLSARRRVPRRRSPV
jgi:predicted ATPase/DNA-binding winged helix-turn-helix (wHTH) protein